MEHHTSKCSLFLALTNKEDRVSARWNNRKLTFKQWCKKKKKKKKLKKLKKKYFCL